MGNFRITKQNALILSIIDNSCEHLSAFDIYKKCLLTISNISLGTVYRNLNNLVDAKKIRRIIDFNGVEHFDNLKKTHNHFICSKCMNIFDVFDNVNIPLDCDLGKVINYEIIYNGICHNCEEEEK